MQLGFLSPSGALLGLAVLIPLAALVALDLRERRVRAALGLLPPPLRSRLPALAALAGVVGLVALAATEPVVERATATSERTDAEAVFVFDISRSMLAAAGTDEPTRLDRAREAASRLRAALPTVPVGIASLTDRALPHLLPTPDARVFESTLQRAVAIERPPPAQFYDVRATSLGALAGVPQLGFYRPTARRRLLVVFTDGETNPVSPAVARAFRRRPRTEALFVHVWNRRERVYTTSEPEPEYRPDPASRATLEQLATLVGGRVVEVDDSAGAEAAARTALGEGPVRARPGSSLRLAPYVALAAIVPLAFLLWRRNL